MTAPETGPLLETLLQRLEETWERGDRVLVESLIQGAALGELSEDELLELVYAEVDARTGRGEQPQLAEYEQRFPLYAERLRRLFEIHRAVETDFPQADEPSRNQTAAKLDGNLHFELMNPSPLPPLRPPSHQQETFIAEGQQNIDEPK